MRNLANFLWDRPLKKRDWLSGLFLLLRFCSFPCFSFSFVGTLCSDMWDGNERCCIMKSFSLFQPMVRPVTQTANPRGNVDLELPEETMGRGRKGSSMHCTWNTNAVCF